ncbi:hypothetical protein PBY51_011469 [Eleginops maclovinus]|uniref:Uncharacterized protein n=1 Tax=Eleginops maclovinus TaxID=56733 RepID=A0AAN8ANX9_ELEMC|nr:hypothetical protein PBY51_011469 [Eleginops maclovinus]
MLRCLTDSGMWAVSPPKKPFKASHVQNLSIPTPAGFGGGCPSWAPRQETKLEGSKGRTETDALQKKTRSCNYEPSWEHLTFPSLTGS